jgi:hypothetical protein
MYEELFVQDKIDYSYDGMKLTIEKNREMRSKFDFQDTGDEEDAGITFFSLFLMLNFVEYAYIKNKCKNRSDDELSYSDEEDLGKSQVAGKPGWKKKMADK